MNIAILTTPFFHDAKEVTRIIDGKKVQGKDRIIFGGPGGIFSIYVS